MVSMCLPSDALLQHLPSYLGFSYLGHGVSLHGCSSKAQLLLLTLDEGYLLTAAPPDLERGVAPLGPPAPVQPPLLGPFRTNTQKRCPFHYRGLECNLKNDTMISINFQGKPFNITVIQVCDLTSNTKEALF